MIKRPLDPRFTQAVLDGRKFTTIRENPWPVGVPIMLYNWSGKPYRSKQTDVGAIVVMGTQRMEITHAPDGQMSYNYPCTWNLWESEGFESRAEMDAWFRPLVPPGQSVTKHLMRFSLITDH